MKKVTAIIERGSDGRYSIYIEDLKYQYGIIGVGDSVKEAEQDFFDGYTEMKSYVESSGERFEEAEFSFKYDVPSFLQEFAYAFSLAGLQRITGVNQKQLSHYISGYRHPSRKTVRKIENGVREFSVLLGSVKFL